MSIRFSQFVINALDASKFQAQRDSYGGRRFGFSNLDEDRGDNGKDIWELWVWREWFSRKPRVSIIRRGKFLDHLTDQEKLDIAKAFDRATVTALGWEAEARAKADRKREADHWWP